jgi:hypothetical protein
VIYTKNKEGIGKFNGLNYIINGIKRPIYFLREETMKILNKQQKGQTLIETALILILLLLILLGIAEFSRAWFTKSSLKNAARTGSRIAVVTQISGFPSGVGPPFATEVEFVCPNANAILNAACTAPGVKNTSDTHLFLQVDDSDSSGSITPGDTITVRVNRINFSAIVPGFFRSFIPTQFSADASMRYE